MKIKKQDVVEKQMSTIFADNLLVYFYIPFLRVTCIEPTTNLYSELPAHFYTVLQSTCSQGERIRGREVGNVNGNKTAVRCGRAGAADGKSGSDRGWEIYCMGKDGVELDEKG